MVLLHIGFSHSSSLPLSLKINKYKLSLKTCTNSRLYKQSRDVKYNIGNIVSNVVITMYGARWVLDLVGDHIVSYANI